MKKIQTILSAPVFSRSGYGQLSHDIFHALNSNERLDVKVHSHNWGNNASMTTAKEKDKEIAKRIMNENEPLKSKPELFISCNLPQSQVPVGVFNILYSCIVETDKAWPLINENLNKYNLVIVPSEYTKQVVLNSEPKIQVPVEVCPWGADINVYKPNAPTCPSVDAQLDKIWEKNIFLFVGQVTHPNLFCDRKDIDTLIKCFCEAFKNKPYSPALVLKISSVNFSFYDRNRLLDRIKQIRSTIRGALPNVYLLHGELNETEMAALYSHKKVMAGISLTHGESWGGFTFMSVLSGKPTFASNGSSIPEYITDSRFLLDGSYKPIGQEIVSEYFPPESKWFFCDEEKVKAKMLDFYKNPEPYQKAAIELGKQASERYNLDKFNYRLNKTIRKYIH